MRLLVLTLLEWGVLVFEKVDVTILPFTDLSKSDCDPRLRGKIVVKRDSPKGSLRRMIDAVTSCWYRWGKRPEGVGMRVVWTMAIIFAQ